jgi:hypothetical protein
MRAIAWPAGATRIVWPDDVPIEDGDTFEIVGGSTPSATLTFHVLAGSFPSEAAWVAAGILSDCHGQFDARLQRLARSAGPPELWLTTDHGRAPVYRAGEPILLTAQTDMDGWLYCILIRSNQSATLIFPMDAAGEALVQSGVSILIPSGLAGRNMQPPAKGRNRIACWLADRDISTELPHAMVDGTASLVPDRVVVNLSAAFSAIGRPIVASAELVINIE